MKKLVNKQIIDYNEELYTISLIGDNCSKNTIEGRTSLIELLRCIINDPNLILTDTLTPDLIEINHDGEKWIIKARATKYENKTTRIKGIE
jgi:hypothetical protein